MDGNNVNNQGNNQLNSQMNNQLNTQMNGQQTNQLSDSQIKSNERKGRGLFYGVIAVATFIIMAVGATFAYFTASTNSGSDSVRTRSASIDLQFISYESGWLRGDLVPAPDYVAEYSFENQSDITRSMKEDGTGYSNGLCQDDNGYSVCSVYVFQVYNTASGSQNVSIQIQTLNNGFTNLKGMLYAIDVAPEQLSAYLSKENNNGVEDPKFRKFSSSDAATEAGVEEPADDESFIQVRNGIGDALSVVVDSDNTIENAFERPTGAFSSTEYRPIFVNRNGVTKRMLTYSDSEDQTRLLPSFGIPIKVDTSDNEGKVLAASNVEIRNNSYQTFALVLYIQNQDYDQTLEDGEKTFEGAIIVTPGEGGDGIKGSIGSISSGTFDTSNLQSQTLNGGSSEPSGGEPTNP